MSPASFVGFTLAFLVTAWALSAVIGGAALAARPRIARRGPRLERSAAAVALLAPPTLGLVVAAVLIVQSWMAVRSGGDHCAAHVHHLHLCVQHGAAWAAEPWAVVTLVVAVTFVLGRTAQLVAAQVGAHLALRRLERLGAERHEDVLVVPSTRVFCFVAGLLRPRVYASTAAWETLDGDARRAMLAHEERHAERRDVARRLGLGWLALFGAPILAPALLRWWSNATERLCDREAADAIGDPTAVAIALLTMARCAATAAPAAVAPFPAARNDLEHRLDALLAPAPTDETAARRWTLIAELFVAASALTAMFTADALHHALETFLGVF